MKLSPNTASGKSFLVLEFWNVTPHLETSLEIAEMLSELGGRVEYQHWGRYLRRNECYLADKRPREEKGIALLSEDINSSYMQYLDSDLESNNKLCPPLPDCRASYILKRQTYNGHPIGVAAYCSLVDKLRDPFPNPVNYQDYINDCFYDFALIYNGVRSLLTKNRFDHIVLFNGRFVAPFAASCAAVDSGVECIFHERGGSIDRYFLHNFVPHDYSLVQSELRTHLNSLNDSSQKRLAVREGKEILKKRMKGISSDGVSFAVNASKLSSAVVYDSENYAYFSSSDDEMLSLPYEHRASPLGAWRDQLAVIHALIDIFRSRPHKQLSIKLHPHYSMKSGVILRQLKAINTPANVAILWPETNISPYSLILSATSVLSMGSTAGIEALALGKESVLLGPSGYDFLSSVKHISSYACLEYYIDHVIPGACDPQRQNDGLTYFWALSMIGNKFKHYRPTTPCKGTFKGVAL